MGFYHLNLDELAEYSGRTVKDLKGESYDSLERMIEEMNKDKFLQQNKKNAEDVQYEHLVRKYFEPLGFLSHWFDVKDIVLACAQTGITVRDLVQEVNVAPGSKCWRSNAEFLRTSVESVRQFDSHGRELMESARMQRDVYRVANEYQSLRHGQVILYLLYGRYPELAQFGFTAYGMSCERDYEIYPKNNIYTSFTALMSGDVDWIIHRNREYCKWYNNSRFSEAEWEKAIRTKEAQKMFDVIRIIGEKERGLGHFPITILDSGAMISAHNLITTKVSESKNITLLMYKDSERHSTNGKTPLKLETAAPYAVERLVYEFLDMVPGATVNVHIADKRDYLMDHAIHSTFTPDKKLDGIEASGRGGFIVTNAFGWKKDNVYDLTLRINCPELMK